MAARYAAAIALYAEVLPTIPAPAEGVTPEPTALTLEESVFRMSGSLRTGEGVLAMRRLIPALVAVVMLTIAPGFNPVIAVDAIQVTLSCSDGTDSTEFTVVVDDEALNQIKGAILAMILWPAGLTCGLTAEVPLTGWFAAVALAQTQGSKDFAVGGGQYIDFRPGCLSGAVANFAFSAHVDSTGGVPFTAQGHIAEKIPDQFGCPGQRLAKVNCLVVNPTGTDPTLAVMTGMHTKVTGTYLPGADPLGLTAKDNSPAPDGYYISQGAVNCPTQVLPPLITIISGNIVVKDRP